jgi:hypothetical protein
MKTGFDLAFAKNFVASLRVKNLASQSVWLPLKSETK